MCEKCDELMNSLPPEEAETLREQRAELAAARAVVHTKMQKFVLAELAEGETDLKAIALLDAMTEAVGFLLSKAPSELRSSLLGSTAKNITASLNSYIPEDEQITALVGQEAADRISQGLNINPHTLH